MKPLLENRGKIIKLLAESLEKWRWIILAIIGLSLLWVEVQEFLVLRILDEVFHYFEVFQYAVLLVSTGVLIELFARSTRAHKQAIKILEYKHRLNLELTSNEDWETLIKKITEIPSNITTVDEAYLLVTDPASGKLEKSGHWQAYAQSGGNGVWDPSIPCKKCLDKEPNERFTFHLCRSAGSTGVSDSPSYSLGLHLQNFPFTVLAFRLTPGSSLSQDEEQIFKNIGDEIVAVLQTSQDRKRLSEMQSAQVAMAERRIVSSFVHDQLGQNLGYMHMKLDQLSNNEQVRHLKGIQPELERLREVANESYEIVRDILKKIQPETIPHLANLLREHSRTVSHRAKFELEFKSTGKAVNLPANTQQLIFFAFREVLANIEKHANAKKVTVLVSWGVSFLDISVADNGQGFEPGAVDTGEHFGLEIMKERIASIKGHLSFNSSAGVGTVVSISVPLESGKMESE